MIAAGIVGLVATGVAGFGIDGLAQRRRFGLGSAKRAAPEESKVAAPDWGNGSASVESAADTGRKIAPPIPLARSRVRHEI
jgi:hypothetical protein